MFKILCEQYKLDAVLPEQAGVDGGVMVLQVACLSGLPIGTPQGPQIIPIPTAVVHVVMDKTERDEVRRLLDAYDAAEGEDAGEAQPEGVEARRCGRLQQHAAHVYPDLSDMNQEFGEPARRWCDGGSVLTDAGGVGEATDELPDATPAHPPADDGSPNIEDLSHPDWPQDDELPAGVDPGS